MCIEESPALPKMPKWSSWMIRTLPYYKVVLADLTDSPYTHILALLSGKQRRADRVSALTKGEDSARYRKTRERIVFNSLAL